MPERAYSLPSAIKLYSVSGVAEKDENVTAPSVTMSSMVAGADTSCSRAHVLAPADDDKQKMELLLCCSQIPVVTYQASQYHPLLLITKTLYIVYSFNNQFVKMQTG